MSGKKSMENLAEYLRELFVTYRKHLGALFAIFAVGLVFFFIFSAPYGDGLEKTMEKAGVEESEFAYHAPLDYGDSYPVSLVMGVVGSLIVLIALSFLHLLPGKQNSKQESVEMNG